MIWGVIRDFYIEAQGRAIHFNMECDLLPQVGKITNHERLTAANDENATGSID